MAQRMGMQISDSQLDDTIRNIAAGEKLSKQTLAPAIDARAAAAELRQALTRLGHAPPAEAGDVAELWQWARGNWQLARVPPGPIVIA